MEHRSVSLVIIQTSIATLLIYFLEVQEQDKFYFIFHKFQKNLIMLQIIWFQ
jgi:hypothetical protein